jgi:hypothetical protein
METLTTNTQTELEYQRAAEAIVDIFEKLGFTSDIQNDPVVIQNEIANTIRQQMEGNINHAPITG